MKCIPFAILGLMSLMTVTLVGCSTETHPVESADARPTTTATNGDIHATATFTTDQLTIAERVSCSLIATAPIGYEISFPSLTDSLGEYTIVDSSRLPPHLTADGIMRHSLTLLLEPFLPGAYDISPLVITATHGDSGDVSTIELPLPVVTVTSVLDDSPESATIGDLKSPLDPPLPAPPTERAWGVIASVAIPATVLVVGGIAFLFVRNRAKPQRDPCLAAIARLNTLASASELPIEAVDDANAALRTCLARSVEPGAASLTTSQLIESSGVKRVLGQNDQDALDGCLRLFERMQFAPGAEADPTLRDSIAQASRLATLVTDSTRDLPTAISNGHATSTGGRA